MNNQILINTDTRTFKLNAQLARNMTDREFLRFVEDSTDPTVQELARRLEVSSSFNVELSKIEDALDALNLLASEMEDVNADADLDKVVEDGAEVIKNKIHDIRSTVEDLEDAWN